MKPTIPLWMFLGAMGAIGLSDECKKLSPGTLGRIVALHWGCAIVSAILLSLGLFLSLYGLFSQDKNRRKYILPCLCNLTLLVVLPITYFGFYIVISNLYHLTDESPAFLSKLVAVAQTADSETKRVKAAKAAYELYGVKLAYLRESGGLASYEPSVQEIAIYVKQKEVETNAEESKKLLKGAMDQWPYLFGFYMGAFFLTFIFGSLWVAFRGPSLKSNLQP